MNVKELRIGNYVHNNVESFALQAKDLIFLMAFDNEHYANPIPLNDEWLTKLGLINDGNERQFLWQLPEHIQEKCKSDNGFKKSAFFYNNREDIKSYMDCQTRRTVQYVHQLQNLVFALTGEELTIQI